MLLGFLTVLPNFNTTIAGEPNQYGSLIYLLIFVIILLCSVFVITPLPGNSLLFVTGAMAMNHILSLEWVFVSALSAAYIGYDLNYWSARILGLAVCRKGCPYIFKSINVVRTHELLEQYGPLAIIISRFIPAVNLPPFFAGLDSMNYRHYALFNLLGAALWCGIILAMGYELGGLGIIRTYLPVLILLVILAVIIALIYGVVTLIRGLLREGRREETG